jgi:hypothetical protein
VERRELRGVGGYGSGTLLDAHVAGATVARPRE